MDKKIIKLDSFNPNLSSISNSPLLQETEVSVKSYSENLNAFKKTEPKTVEPAKNEQKITEKKNKWDDDYKINPPTDTPPPVNEYANDDVEEMKFNEGADTPKQEDEESEFMSPSEAKGQAEMMINMYSAFIPPALAKMLKKDVAKVGRVMRFNKISEIEIKKLENFLNTKNNEIAKALQLTKEQVGMLKQALSAVLERYKLNSDNPLVNLIIIVFGIAVTQFMSVSALINAQFEQLKEIIEARNLAAPDGDEDFATPQGIFKKKIKIKTAA